MTYAFVLGRVYTLSLAELLEVLSQDGQAIQVLDMSPEVLVVETEKPLLTEALQARLGGVIKILKIIDVVKKREPDSINFTLENYFKPSKIKADYIKDAKGKIQFGVSVYLLDMSVKAFGEPKKLGMFIKRGIQDAGSSVRLVLPEFNSLALASVVVTKNLLIEKGAEICILAGKDKLYVGKTLRVQDFEDYGRRDYQRPVRDAERGMIPPKVAQSMVNLARVKTGGAILDPFCGIGTIVHEGVMQGYKMVGTDKDRLAILGAEKNLEWIRNRYKISKGRYHLETSDVKQVSQIIDNIKSVKAIDQISAIVTEGTLGPIYGKLPEKSVMDKNFQDLIELYKDSFTEFSKVLLPGARVVMCLPAYKLSQNSYELLPSLDFAVTLGYNKLSLIPQELLKKYPFLRLTTRGTVIYDRKDQIVAREIVIFQKS